MHRTKNEVEAELIMVVCRLRELLGLNEKATRDETIYIADAVSDREPFSELGRLTTDAYELCAKLRRIEEIEAQVQIWRPVGERDGVQVWQEVVA